MAMLCGALFPRIGDFPTNFYLTTVAPYGNVVWCTFSAHRGFPYEFLFDNRRTLWQCCVVHFFRA
jgi:hypothetical protein